MNNALSTGKNSIFGPAALCTGLAGRLERERAERCVNTDPALNITAVKERLMSLIPDKPGVCPGQALEDPLVANARFLNEAANLERRLAVRRALRPVRSQSAHLGWESRRAR